MSTTETIPVPGIHCDHCKASIEGALSPLEGLSEVSADIAGRQVTVSYDETLLDHDAIVRAIEEQGYEVPA
ncbi:MAG: heavy-metal-associated domain-containing protein [Egibacteraceae bacterium]